MLFARDVEWVVYACSKRGASRVLLIGKKSCGPFRSNNSTHGLSITRVSAIHTTRSLLSRSKHKMSLRLQNTGLPLSEIEARYIAQVEIALGAVKA